MSHFVKLTTLTEDGNFLRTWIDQDDIVELSQNSATQASNNEGTCELIDGTDDMWILFNNE